MKKVYICSPLRGDMENNIRFARRYCRYAVKEHGVIPIAPHIYFTQFLDDTAEKEREFGLNAGLSLLSDCDALWYFGSVITEGMKSEILYAQAHGIAVSFVPEYKYEKYIYERKNETYEMQ